MAIVMSWSNLARCEMKGLSTDIKPGLDATVTAGSTFTETDTGFFFVLNAAGLWIKAGV